MCTSDWSGVRCGDRELQLKFVPSWAENPVVKRVQRILIQLSVTHPVLMEVHVLLLTHVPVFLNGLDPLVQLVR